MSPSLRSALSFLLSITCGSVAAQAPADAPELVVLAQPSPSDALDSEARDLTLPYTVLEVFEGEPPGDSIVVRHRDLDADGRARLRGERVILTARRDPDSPGRFVAPAPLRATPAALAAFRRWSAPEDVRAARSGADAEGAGPEQPAVSTPAPKAATATTARERDPAPPSAAKAPKSAPPRATSALPRETSALPRETSAPPRAAAVAAPAPAAALPRGPGLPPVPGRTLGPPLAERHDLPAPRRGGRRR